MAVFGLNCALHQLSFGLRLPSLFCTSNQGRLPSCSFGPRFRATARPFTASALPYAPLARISPPRTASTPRLLAPSPRAGSRLFRWQFLEALPPETRGTENARGVSARKQDPALRASAHGPCDTRDGDAGRNRSSRLFPKAGRSRKHGSPRYPKEGVLRGYSSPSGKVVYSTLESPHPSFWAVRAASS